MIKRIALSVVLIFVLFVAFIYFAGFTERCVFGVDYINIDGRIISGQISNFGEMNTECIELYDMKMMGQVILLR